AAFVLPFTPRRPAQARAGAIDLSVQIHKHPERIIEPAVSATSFKLRTSWAQRRIPTGSRSRVRKRASAKCDRPLVRDALFDNFGRFYFGRFSWCRRRWGPKP